MREVMLGERRTKLPENSLQVLKLQNKKMREQNDSHASVGGTSMTSMPPSAVATIQESQLEVSERGRTISAKKVRVGLRGLICGSNTRPKDRKATRV